MIRHISISAAGTAVAGAACGAGPGEPLSDGEEDRGLLVLLVLPAPLPSLEELDSQDGESFYVCYHY